MLDFVLIPTKSYFDLPDDRCRSLLACLLAHTDKAGVCFPNMRQMAEIVGCSPATVCRRLRVMEGLGVFQRERVRTGGRYRYTIAEPYRRAPKLLSAAAETAVSLVKRSVSGGQPGVSKAATQKAESSKQSIEKDGAPPNTSTPIGSEIFKWRARLRQLREFGRWSDSFGPLPGEPGCKAPPELLAEMLGHRAASRIAAHSASPSQAETPICIRAVEAALTEHQV